MFYGVEVVKTFATTKWTRTVIIISNNTGNEARIPPIIVLIHETVLSISGNIMILIMKVLRY